jgi:hypothetical protein
MRRHALNAFITLFAACELIALCAPGSVDAEAFEGRPHCSGFEPGAVIPQPSDFTAAVGMAVRPQAVEFTDSEDLPAGDFTATANWGDGTEAAASVSGEGCYEVTTTSTHAYNVSGAYPFTYTVHDTHTGLSHTVGAHTLYIWALPQLLPGAPQPKIVATVGVPWSGTLLELTNPPSPAPSILPYTASIGWEPEREGEHEFAHYQATVTAQPNGTLAVSASHTFSEPLVGTVRVEVRAAELLGKLSVPLEVKPPEPSPAAHPQRAAYQLVGRPVLATFPRTRAGSDAEIVFRLNRQLPLGHSGHPAAHLKAQGFATNVSRFGPDGDHACYALPADGSLGDNGKRAFALAIPQSDTTLAWHAYPRRYSSFAQMSRAVAAHLGC